MSEEAEVRLDDGQMRLIGRFTEVIRASKDFLRIIDENNTKLVLKVYDEPAIEMKVEDNGTAISVDIIEPEHLGSLVQQFRSVFMSSEGNNHSSRSNG